MKPNRPKSRRLLNFGEKEAGIVKIDQGNYTVDIFEGADGLDAQNDNVDVQVNFPSGEFYTATFFTVDNIRHLLEEGCASSIGNNISCFWCPDMILVERLTTKVILEIIEGLIKREELKNACAGPYREEA